MQVAASPRRVHCHTAKPTDLCPLRSPTSGTCNWLKCSCTVFFMTDSWLLTLEVVYIKWYENCEYWIQKDAEERVNFWFEADAQCLFLFFNLLDRFSKSTQTLNSVKIHPVEAKLFHVDRWMERQYEAFHNIANVPNKRLHIKTIILQRRGISLCHVKRRS